MALGDYRMLESRRNLIISAPTNSGKSLLGMLVLLDAVRRGHRAILLEPLRAIAREKAEELQTASSHLAVLFHRPFTVRLSTGDYRLEEETFAAPPPDTGEIIIATPERFDAILRNPEYDHWLASIGAVCVDEAHLVSASHRGPTLEYVLTSLLCLAAPPRLVLLSATLGDVTRAAEWLSPCDVITIKERCPPLQKEVLALTAEEDANDIVTAIAQEVLDKTGTGLLIFVYQTRAAERLATLLQKPLQELAGNAGPLAYHGQISAERRNSVRTAFHTGQCRCIVATTALGLGVNLPATHVLIRDTTFAGVGPLSSTDLLQMMGRAGRGDQPGHAMVIVRPQDAWNAEELAQALREETLPPFVSHFEQVTQRMTQKGNASDANGAAAKLIAAYLARCGETGTSRPELLTFFRRSLGGEIIAAQIDPALAWLTAPSQVLAFRDDHERYRLTALGMKAVRAVLPLPVASGFAQLIRDLLSLDGEDRFLSEWRPLDHLLLLELLSDHAPTLRPFSQKLAEQLDSWMESTPDHTSVLYREWIAGQRGASRANEVLGSLGLPSTGQGKDADEWARKTAYLALWRAAVLYERGQGKEIAQVERQWSITGLEGIEERWRDDGLWLLAGIAKILDLRCFYFHLREECAAGTERVQRIKRLLRRMRAQVFDLQEHLKYCSPLGPVLRSLRRMRREGEGASIGVQSIRRLEEAGIRSIVELAMLQLNDLVRLGVRRDLAKQIRSYMRRRLQ
jgi:superfamily II DNA/RNA helicase